MKVKLIIGISTLLLVLSVLVIVFNINSINYESILTDIAKGNFEAVLNYTGPLYDYDIKNGGLNIRDIEKQYGEIENFELLNISKDKTMVSYSVIFDGLEYLLDINWEPQPKKLLIAGFDIYLKGNFGMNDSFDLPIPKELTDKTEDIMKLIISKNYEVLFQSISEDFGNRVGVDISNYEDLATYIENEFSYVKPVISSYCIGKSYVDGIYGDNVQWIILNPNELGELTLVLRYNNVSQLIGIYIKEVDEMKNKTIFSDEEFEDVTKNQSNFLETDFLPQESYKLKNEKYSSMYSYMSEDFRNTFTISDYISYMKLMMKRTGCSILENSFSNFVDYLPYYNYENYNARVLIGTEDIHQKQWLSDEHIIKNYVNYHHDIEFSGEDFFVNGIFLSRINIYDPKYLNQNTDEFDSELYYPVFNNETSNLSDDENRNIRLMKSDQLIKALIYQDFDTLWEIEKRYTSFNEIDDLKELYTYQERLVKGFEGVYKPVIGYDWGICGSYILEYAFMTFDDHYNKLLIMFDKNNEIIDYNVISCY